MREGRPLAVCGCSDGVQIGGRMPARSISYRGTANATFILDDILNIGCSDDSLGERIPIFTTFTKVYLFSYLL